MFTRYQTFNALLLSWFDKHGRKGLPWQHPRNGYRVWISEIMLQQTQVKTVIPYFMAFIARFPDVKTLATASEDDVLSHWSGLGYYSRARNLHKSAMIIHTERNDEFPNNLESLLKLPGIGESTAAAIASLAFNKASAILDGNVKRVLSRYFLVAGAPDSAEVKQQLWHLANACMHQDRCADYTQAIMDLGATVCRSKKPDCIACPLQATCQAFAAGVVDDYPHKKPQKTLPTKTQQFLLLHTDDNLIYLEKRPPKGLWGGLWCMPAIAMDVCPASHIRNTYPFQIDEAQVVMKIKHSFSHFHLHILALSFQSRKPTAVMAECTGRWFRADEMGGLGLAKPVSLIISRFFSPKF